MFRVPLFLLSLLGAVLLVSPSAAQTPSPKTAAKLLRLLPLPEGTLNPQLEISTMGLSYSPGQGYTLFRRRNDYAAQIVQVRRMLTGGIKDAARERRLGNLYRVVGLAGKSAVAFRQSENICRNILRREPDNGLALAEYGRTLEASGRVAAAEAYLQKAVKTAPDSPEVWLALGHTLSTEAAPATEPKMHFARKAEEAYDHAVCLAPRNPAAWIARADFRTWDLPQASGQFVSRDGLTDYEHAAALTPNDPYAQAQVATIDCFTFELAHHMFTSLKATKMEPPSSDHRAEAILRHITAIAHSTSGKQSAEAYAARAWVQFEFFHDAAGAQRSVRLALVEYPAEQDAIDYRMHVALVTGDHALLAAACRRELERRPGVYLRVVLAYADYFLAQQKPNYWREGLAQMELAHAAAPRDYAFALGLATFLLETGQAHRANALLNKIAPRVQTHPKEQQTEYDLTRGVGATLAGQEQDAQAFFSLARKNDPKNQAASALALLPN